jgi:heat shock protein HtpX
MSVSQLPAQRLNVYSAIASNRRRSVLLVALFVILVAALGYVLGELYAQGAGLFFLPLAAVIAMAWAATSYFAGDQIVLGLSRAHEVTEAEQPVLHHIASALAAGAGVPAPRLYVIDDAAPNAFATGRDPRHSSIAVTSGLLAKLDRTELEGVLAHELSHVRNYDIRFMLLVTVLVGIAALLSNFFLRSMWWGGRGRSRDNAGVILLVVGLVLAIITPIVVQLIRFAVSRQREYLADADGALLTRYPPGLASALRKIANDPQLLKAANRASAPLYIANPFKNAGRWFDTHPPIEDRIRRLESM